jgi:hypothetical protein
MVSINITHNQWNKLAVYRDESESSIMNMRSSREMKQYIKDAYHGEYSQLRGFGTITFEHEHHLTWFLLNI